MKTTVNFWQTLSQQPMSAANPCNLMDQGNVKVPAETGFLFKLGGDQLYGLYFPNGAEITKDAGFVSATTSQPIEVYDSTQGRGTQTLSEAIPGLPIMLICDNSAKGLTFDVGGSSNPGVNVTPWIVGTSGLSGPKFRGGKGVTPQQQQVRPNPSGKLARTPRAGRNTAAAKVIGIGNWDFIPDLLDA